MVIGNDRQTNPKPCNSNTSAQYVGVESIKKQAGDFPTNGKTANETQHFRKATGYTSFLHFLEGKLVVGDNRFHLTHRFYFHPFVIKMVFLHGNGITGVLRKR